MKILITILGVLLLAGCEPNSMEKAKQDQACQDKGGVYRYRVAFSTSLVCRNGDKINSDDWYNQLLTEEFYPEKGEK